VDPLTTKLRDSPALARTLPFVIFVALTFGQGLFGEASRYWFYLAKTIVGAWLVWRVWPVVTEMRWAMSWEAVVAGVAVFGLWVGLDGLYPSLDALLKTVGLGGGEKAAGAAPPWNPFLQFGQGTAPAWLFVVVRIAGSTLVVPPIEEAFYRSFLYRFIAKPDFQAVPLGAFLWTPFLLAALIFGLGHHEWLAGILCAFVFQVLVCWKKRLGDAMTAHAITNFLLGIWVVWKGAWHFW
jgi:CAAX prenyl protease-like protein